MRTDARQLSRSARSLPARLASAELPDIAEARKVLDAAPPFPAPGRRQARRITRHSVRLPRAARRLGSPGVPGTPSKPGPPRWARSSEVRRLLDQEPVVQSNGSTAIRDPAAL